MSKGSDRYPEDEFDAAPAEDAPIGVHRAPRSWWSRWWPFVAVVVLVPALTVVFVLWASSWDGRIPGFGTSETPVASAPAQPETEAPAESAAPSEPAVGGRGPPGGPAGGHPSPIHI
ncbi:hypothetical protein [Cellulomonas hominis]|uniref:hypothetical protein n=1 Tax=Cellulomonas hominis TaxID=156981 RepID=UPI001B9A0348|nr:hypothetical protein [Cellulomonas hominis]VTR78408.1 hypothetical protein CHMI_03189 [Cellulomonas hominis]